MDDMSPLLTVFLAALGVLGFLASVFNWNWYFRLSSKSRRWDDLFGRKVYRIINAVLCILFFVGAIYLSVSGS